MIKTRRYLSCYLVCNLILDFDPGKLEKKSLQKIIKNKSRLVGHVVRLTYCHKIDRFSYENM